MKISKPPIKESVKLAQSSETEENVCDPDTNALPQFVIIRLKEIMETRHFSRYKVSRLTGIAQPSLSNFLKGKCSPSLYTLDMLCKGLGISFSDFFRNDKSDVYPLSMREREMLEAWNELDDTQQAMMIAYAQGMIAQKKLKK